MAEVETSSFLQCPVAFQLHFRPACRVRVFKMDNTEKEPILAVYTAYIYVLASRPKSCRVYKQVECVERLSEVGNCSGSKMTLELTQPQLKQPHQGSPVIYGT